MSRKIANPFGCMSPPTVETFAWLLRVQFRQSIRHAISEFRAGNREGAAYFLGIADGMVYALYDVNTDDAYDKLTRLRRVRYLTGIEPPNDGPFPDQFSEDKG